MRRKMMGYQYEHDFIEAATYTTDLLLDEEQRADNAINGEEGNG